MTPGISGNATGCHNWASATGLSDPRHSAMAGSYLPQSVSSVQVEKPSLKPSCWWCQIFIMKKK